MKKHNQNTTHHHSKGMMWVCLLMIIAFISVHRFFPQVNVLWLYIIMFIMHGAIMLWMHKGQRALDTKHDHDKGHTS